MAITPLNQGGTGADLSATGGAHQVVKQSAAGANLTVGQLAASDLSDGTSGSGAVGLATGATVSPKNVSSVLYADQFAGSDIGAKINAAFTAAGATPTEV